MEALRDPRLRLHLRQLEVFIATAHGGSTRAAADRIFRSQSAASSALVELEDALGVKLFDRVGRRLVLNDNGRALLPKALWLVDHALSVQDLFSTERPQPLRISASFTIAECILPRIIARWNNRHPGVIVQLKVENSSQVMESITESDVDIGFIEGCQTHKDVVSKPWLSDELLIVASPLNRLAGRHVSRDDLRAASWAAREPGSGTREHFDRWLHEYLGKVKIEFELGSTGAIKQLVVSSTALSCLSRHAVADELELGQLVKLDVDLPGAVRRLSMMTRRDKQLSSQTESFIFHCLRSEEEKDGYLKPHTACEASADI